MLHIGTTTPIGTTTHIGTTTPSRLPTEATAVPQEGPDYVLIGVSASGGVLVLLIAALVIRKCLRKHRISSVKHSTDIGKVNDCVEGDFELSTVPQKI